MERATVIVVGAGVSGLACAQVLEQAGLRPVVLERSRGVGGRCATRRVEGQPVDHGLIFLHGDDPELRKAIETVDSPPLEGWPRRVHGSGAPCQPAAFAPGQWRVAFADGVSAFPKSLASGLDVRLLENVDRLAVHGGQWTVVTHLGHQFQSPNLVLALALEQTRQLLQRLAVAEPAVVPIERLLGTFATLPSLTLLAGYPASSDEVPWDVAYPEDSSILQLVSHDSAKRRQPAWTVLVYQAQAAWSRKRLDDDPSSWSNEILTEGGRIVGRWARQPAWTQTHRWRYSRLDGGNELVCPIGLTLAGGARLVLAGELFHPGGGLQAAFRAGRQAGQRVAQEVRQG